MLINKRLHFCSISKSLKLNFTLIILLSTIGFSCFKENTNEEKTYNVLLSWNKQLLVAERYTTGYRPPVSARMFAYVQICAYETLQPKLANHKTLCGTILPDSVKVFAPNNFDMALALNSAYAQISKYFFANTTMNQAVALDKLELKLINENKGDLDSSTIQLSINYGKKVADKIWQYASTDTYGHEANLYSYDKEYIIPKCAGCWSVTGDHPVPPLLPHWGSVRTFIIDKSQCTVRAPLTYDANRNSSFYAEAMELFVASHNRTYDDIWVAEFWSDDLPELTVSPVGRWFSILTQYASEQKFSLPQLIAAYVKLGIALNDAAVLCWDAKYKYNLIRPETYIQQNISPNWKPLHDSPNFPAYPSGHSAFGTCSAEIIKYTLGNFSDFTDKTHEHRPEFKGKPRTYHSIDEMALENALSRITMGVHYRMDCEEGMRLGKVVGQSVSELALLEKNIVSD